MNIQPDLSEIYTKAYKSGLSKAVSLIIKESIRSHLDIPTTDRLIEAIHKEIEK